MAPSPFHLVRLRAFPLLRTPLTPSSLRAAAPRPGATQQSRAASHASQGTANRGARGPGKRLGAKKGASAPVVPGNILFRQRGSLWFPGENCVMGRDHTISALQPGFVRYYRDPARHPTRKYIGVVLRQEHALPRPPNAPRRRRLGLDAAPRADEPDAPAEPPADQAWKHGYQVRVTNAHIGRLGLRVGHKLAAEDRKYKKLVSLRRRAKRPAAAAPDGGKAGKAGKAKVKAAKK